MSGPRHEPAPPFAATVVRRGVLPSTNDLAKELLGAGNPALPLLVLADRQTSGRGRGSNTWWSDAGSLTFTVAIDPAAHGLGLAHEPRIALATAVAIVDAIDPILPRRSLGIRWPNDLEAGGKKLGGILPEGLDMPEGRRVLIGIGLNVDTDLEAAPPEIRRMATTVRTLRGAPTSRDEVLVAVLAKLGPALEALAVHDPGLAERWNALDTLRGHPVRINRSGQVLAGTARGIADDGGLRLETGGGSIVIYGGRVLRD